jgi:inosine-uridine nucleoside N-ribohydrolase
MHRIIVNTDPGIDDAMALLYVLCSPEALVEAIMSSHGNVSVEVATQNVFEILRISELPDLPEVAQGVASPDQEPTLATNIHGKDGLGGWRMNQPPSFGKLSKLTAPQLIGSIARQHPNEVTLVALAPLTNLSLALRQDPVGFRMLKEIVMMGGTVLQPGNVTAVAEFNIYLDPEAARAVLNSGVPTVLVALDVTERAQLTPSLLDGWLRERSDLRARFLRCICSHWFASSLRETGWEGLHLHDPLTMAIALDRSLATTRRMKVDVEVCGQLTRGMLIAERRGWISSGGENVEICVDIDTERFLTSFKERVINPSCK